MYDPGNVYLVGFAMLSALVAVTLFFAKRALDKRGEKTELTMTPIIACVSVTAILLGVGVAKITIFADFYNTHSIYVPA